MMDDMSKENGIQGGGGVATPTSTNHVRLDNVRYYCNTMPATVTTTAQHQSAVDKQQASRPPVPRLQSMDTDADRDQRTGAGRAREVLRTSLFGLAAPPVKRIKRDTMNSDTSVEDDLDSIHADSEVMRSAGGEGGGGGQGEGQLPPMPPMRYYRAQQQQSPPPPPAMSHNVLGPHSTGEDAGGWDAHTAARIVQQS